jgi:hypothetical protein
MNNCYHAEKTNTTHVQNWLEGIHRRIHINRNPFGQNSAILKERASGINIKKYKLTI